MEFAMDKIVFKPIGTIYSPYTKPEGTPIQPSAAGDIQGKVEIYPEYSKGLKDIDGFSHIILIYYFHLCSGQKLEVIPFMDTTLRGVFATRAPCRPNPIGISTVRLEKIEGNILFVRGIDAVNGTPLLDIKPYVPEFNSPGSFKIGWLKERIHKLGTSRDDGRFVKEVPEK